MQPYTHFRSDERACLASYLREGKNMAEIAVLLERSISTISPGIKRRNKQVKPDGTYYHPSWPGTGVGTEGDGVCASHG
ncbi:MAG: helix-turn-helix domain-containing protein [Christensenellaceae bacterium]|nr:helix-turn-helix domain-containing protein [Christensenellaceae bacterium]